MRALVLSSTSLRHAYFAKTAAKYFDLAAVLVEEKKGYYKEQRESSALVDTHFKQLQKSEAEIFREARDVAQTIEPTKVADINTPEVVDWAGRQEPDVVLLFGTSILREGWLSRFPNRIVNIHLGLSPFYRGSATLFWPFVYRELECLGTTIHLAEAKVDAGEILARVRPDWVVGEDYYTITYKLVKKTIDLMPQIVLDHLAGRREAVEQEKIPGRLCRKADFSEAVLEKMLDYVGNGISAAEIARVTGSEKCRCSP